MFLSTSPNSHDLKADVANYTGAAGLFLDGYQQRIVSQHFIR